MSKKGFTLLELLVVIAIIGFLSTLLIVTLDNVRKKTRDAKRMVDLKQLQKAVEMYYDDNGQYPLGCQGSGHWSGHCPTYGNCDTNYIVGISKYIAKLPIDPRWDTESYGYLYRSDGKDYSILAHFSMETVCGGDPSNPCNPSHIQQMDRACCIQPTIAVYSSGAKDW